VFSPDGSPIAGAVVTISDQQFVTDDQGVWFGAVEYTPQLRQFVTAPNYLGHSYREIQLPGPNVRTLPLRDIMRSVFEPDPEYYARSPGTPPTITDFTSNTGLSRSQELPSETSSITVTGTVGNRDGQSQVRTVAYLAKPDDFVDEVPLNIQGNVFSGTFPIARGEGVYRVEINDTSGAAVINVPIFVGVPYQAEGPIWPDEADLTDDGPTARALEAIQQLRATHNLPLFAIDPRLQKVAQDHVADMVAGNWVCHCFGDHSSILEHVQATGVDPAHIPVPNAPNRYTLGVGNAIATIPGAAAIKGLFNSPGHRTDLMGPYTHIGLAYAGQQSNHTGRFSIVYAKEQ
jgi:uncharacterized protein YkwD